MEKRASMRDRHKKSREHSNSVLENEQFKGKVQAEELAAFRRFYNETYFFTREAEQRASAGQIAQAISMYVESLGCIQCAMEVEIDSTESDASAFSVTEMRRQLTETRLNVYEELNRLNRLITTSNEVPILIKPELCGSSEIKAASLKDMTSAGSTLPAVRVKPAVQPKPAHTSRKQAELSRLNGTTKDVTCSNSSANSSYDQPRLDALLVTKSMISEGKESNKATKPEKENWEEEGTKADVIAPKVLAVNGLESVEPRNQRKSKTGHSSQAKSDNGIKEIYSIADGVQVFFINPGGLVSAPSYPSNLLIYSINREAIESVKGSVDGQKVTECDYHLTIGNNFSYQFFPAGPAVLRTLSGAYIFSDYRSSTPGSAVGLIVPQFAVREHRELFEDLLGSLATLQFEQPPTTMTTSQVDVKVLPKKEHTSTEMGNGMVNSAGKFSKALVKGAMEGGRIIKSGSSYVQGKLEPAGDKPVKVNSRVQNGARYLRRTTGTTLKMTAQAVEMIGNNATAFGKKASPRVKNVGRLILPKAWTEEDDEGRNKFSGISDVAHGGVRAWATVYTGLEGAAKILAKNLADETVHVVKHKYGDEASELAENSVYTGLSVLGTVATARNLGKKAVSRQVMKQPAGPQPPKPEAQGNSATVASSSSTAAAAVSSAATSQPSKPGQLTLCEENGGGSPQLVNLVKSNEVLTTTQQSADPAQQSGSSNNFSESVSPSDHNIAKKSESLQSVENSEISKQKSAPNTTMSLESQENYQNLSKQQKHAEQMNQPESSNSAFKSTTDKNHRMKRENRAKQDHSGEKNSGRTEYRDEHNGTGYSKPTDSLSSTTTGACTETEV